MKRLPDNRTRKWIFIIESDPERKKEIREALSHQTTWELVFFDSQSACLADKENTPMVVFMDIEHFEKNSSDVSALEAVSAIHHRWHETALIVFCDSEKEHEAAGALKKGALDYIVLNNHQYARMESELTWIEGILEQRVEDKKQKRYLIYICLGMLVFFLTMVILDYLGYIHEGTETNILLGD
jgi:DNA-binding NtrC family response regulator